MALVFIGFGELHIHPIRLERLVRLHAHASRRLNHGLAFAFSICFVREIKRSAGPLRNERQTLLHIYVLGLLGLESREVLYSLQARSMICGLIGKAACLFSGRYISILGTPFTSHSRFPNSGASPNYLIALCWVEKFGSGRFSPSTNAQWIHIDSQPISVAGAAGGSQRSHNERSINRRSSPIFQFEQPVAHL
jgi:hypothetical protein